MDNNLETAISILNKFNEAGFQAFIVGGYVRDYLLGIESTDIDITTNATPKEVANLFTRVKETGLKYGTVTVLIDDFSYEVTTFRSDGVYKDNRHPENIQYFHVENIKNHLLKQSKHPSTGKSAAHTGWVLENILGNKNLTKIKN